MFPVKRFIYLIYGILLSIKNIHPTTSHKEITVATYNLWNVMFTWEARKYFIAEMIKEASPDVIGFQEVRSDLSGHRNQLLELQDLLDSSYKHYTYYPVRKVVPPADQQGLPGWEQEGLGILSKHPIMLSHAVTLKTNTNNEDKNKRMIVHVQLSVNDEELDVTLVHLSYDRQQQCQNSVDIINYLASIGSERSVVLGDFNAYEDFSWPIAAMTMGSFATDSACKPDRYFEPQDSGRGYGYVDAWEISNPNEKGYTFSNMPHPGLINRPDRILVSTTGLGVVRTQLLGGGTRYKDSLYYSTLNNWYRLKTVLSFANQSLQGSSITYTCHQDCGPHGSCRCGVCVQGGNEHNCDFHFCYECSPSHYNSLVVLIFCAAVYCGLLMYIILKLFVQYLQGRRRRSNQRILVLLPNRTLFMLLVSIVFMIYLITILNFSDTLDTVIGRIPEEMFPSDHLMVVGTLKVTYR